jgi:DnaJ-class molecular chaperone
MAQHHPDKVTHLGPLVRESAHRKSQEITRAYRARASR